MTYIPPENRDTRYALWHVRYKVRVPYISTISADDLEQFGMYTSGDKHHDHAMQWEPKLCELPIHRIAELYGQGANISLVNREDTANMYKAITLHLSAWRNYLHDTYHPVDPPVDDLLLLDQLAAKLYPHAAAIFDTGFVQKHFGMSANSSGGRKTLLAALAKQDEELRKNRNSDNAEFKAIKPKFATAKYDPNATIAPVDYSGRVEDKVIPQRASLASFFKKEKN